MYLYNYYSWNIIIGVKKLVNDQIISFFEHTNNYAQNIVDNSPLVSPIGSPSRSLRSY